MVPTITMMSPAERQRMNVLGTFRKDLCLMKMKMRRPFPTSPTMKMMRKIKGTRYVSGRFLYGT